MPGALHVYVRFTCVIYFSKTLILLSKSTYPVSNVIHMRTEHINIPEKNIYTSLVGKKTEKAACPQWLHDRGQ